jgi:glycerol-3-phosphate dehydrogenase (NAD(P)+)
MASSPAAAANAAAVGIVGAGAWGTALAMAARRAGCDTLLWAFEDEVVEAVNSVHRNPIYLPDAELDDAIRATGTLGDLADVDVLLLAPPAQHLRDIVDALAGRLPAATPLIICSKGIEAKTGALMSEAVAPLFPDNPLLILSGPTFASDVAAELPTAVTLAGDDIDTAYRIADILSSTRFRPYAADDVVGAQIGGAVKNVLAIACGIADGRGFGDNARAALITRGLAELTRLCVAKGGRAETMMGLSGLGDLVLTCTSAQSRNYSLGYALGEGRTMADILAERRSVAEGVFTAGAAAALAAKLGIDMPITSATDAVLNRSGRIDDVIEALLARPLRAETD